MVQQPPYPKLTHSNTLPTPCVLTLSTTSLPILTTSADHHPSHSNTPSIPAHTTIPTLSPNNILTHSQHPPLPIPADFKTIPTLSPTYAKYHNPLLLHTPTPCQPHLCMLQHHPQPILTLLNTIPGSTLHAPTPPPPHLCLIQTLKIKRNDISITCPIPVSVASVICIPSDQCIIVPSDTTTEKQTVFIRVLKELMF